MYFECYKSSVLIPFWEITNIEMNTENISYDNDYLKSYQGESYRDRFV